MNKFSSQELLAQLISFATISRDSNLELIDFIQDYLTGHGVKSELFYNAEKTKANLFATIGPKNVGGIILSGHTDVVPVDGQKWTSDPFHLSQKDDRLYGRGTADMKGFIASLLASVPSFIKADLKIPIHLALSYDEEVGCLGVRPMLDELAKRPLKFQLCLIGEPTEMKPMVGHKGKLAMRCCVKGSTCHSAYAPYGVNAIEYAARLINHLTKIGKQLSQPEQHDHQFDPPYSTIQTGIIKGGRALNIVPEECEFDFEVRALPNFDAQNVVDELYKYAQTELIPSMRRVQSEATIEMKELSAYPGLTTAVSSTAAQLIAQMSGADDFGTVAFGTEGGLYNNIGIPTIICGPGNMAQGHKPDEFIHVHQLEACDAMLARLANHLTQNTLFD